MKFFFSVIILILFVIGHIICAPRRKTTTEITEKFSRSKGERVAVDCLIQKYELEHQKLYKEEVGNGTHLQWPDLKYKNLSDYCRKYLQHSAPKRTPENINGTQMERTLNYEKENTNMTSNIVVVQCRVKLKTYKLFYYMTRAPEANCVYALKSYRNQGNYLLIIIHKYCDFENNQTNKSIKWKIEETICTIHRKTGQPIAKNEYLKKYELEHQALLQREGKLVGWPQVTSAQNLDVYCYRYMSLCVPGRNRGGIKGTWTTETLRYVKSNINVEISVIVVQCRQDNTRQLNYYMTRALESNCVYALLRQNGKKFDPLIIIFKYCDFEDQNGEQTVLHKINSACDVILQSEMKKETHNTLNTFPLF